MEPTADGDMMTFRSEHPGRDVQRVGTARVLGEPIERISGEPWGVIGTLGDSQCYLDVRRKVDHVHRALSARIDAEDLDVRLIAPTFATGVSDGQLNGTARMRYSLVSREVVRDTVELHLRANALAGVVAVVACDKPPVGVLAALLEHNEPAVVVPDGSIHPGRDPETGERLDLVAAYQLADHPDDDLRCSVALNACPGFGSCGGMFTYNTMQVFTAVAGMTPLHMVSPASDDVRRVEHFPTELAGHLAELHRNQRRPRDIVTPASLRNALITAIAMGGSTNVMLHAAEIARAAGLELWRDVVTQDEFNRLSHEIPVLVDLRPFGRWSIVDLDAVGGVPVIAQELLRAGWIDGSTVGCTGETLAAQLERLQPARPDETIAFPVDRPFKPSGGLRLLRGNLAPNGGAVLKTAGVDLTRIDRDGRFSGRARVFDSEKELIAALTVDPDGFADRDVVVIRYEGPRGAPGMPELLDPTSRITRLCSERGITIALITDARFSGGSVGLVVGHVAPEAYLGGPLSLVEDGDTITIDLQRHRLDCVELDDPEMLSTRAATRTDVCPPGRGGLADSALLRRMRNRARPALDGAGIDEASSD